MGQFKSFFQRFGTIIFARFNLLATGKLGLYGRIT